MAYNDTPIDTPEEVILDDETRHVVDEPDTYTDRRVREIIRSALSRARGTEAGSVALEPEASRPGGETNLPTRRTACDQQEV